MLKTADAQVRETIRNHNLLKQGDHVVLGLSGGPDSLGLFHILIGMAEELELTIHAVHVNHKFRPGAAERDQSFVEEICEKFGVDCHSFVIDCAALAEELGMTSEEAGRKARYDAFFEVALEISKHINGVDKPEDETCKIDNSKPGCEVIDNVKIVVAQNAEDQAETILFRLLRGTGVDGLAGIAYERLENKGGKGIKVVRPLLDTRRVAIEKYCEKQGLTPVRDHTNEEAVYARNKIRLELLPYLEKNYNSNIRESLTRLGKIAASDKEFMWETTEMKFRELLAEGVKRDETGANREVVLDREGLATCHEAIRHRVLLKAFAEIGLESDITAERIAAADKIISKKQGPKSVEFPRGYMLTVAKGKVKFYRRTL